MELYNNQSTTKNFGLKHAWTVLFLSLATIVLVRSLLVQILRTTATSLNILNADSDAWLIVIASAVCYLLLFYAINKLAGKGTISISLFADKHIDWTVYILALLTILSLSIVLEPLSTLLLKLLPMSDAWSETFSKSFTPSLSTLVMVAIIAPVCEETILRGVILRGLLTSISPKRAIIWSSFFFALIHLNPWQALPAFVIGLFLGWIYYKTRSIWPCIFIHLANNLFAFISITIAHNKGLGVDATLEDLTGGYFYSLFATAVVILIFSLGLLHKRYRLKRGNNP